MRFAVAGLGGAARRGHLPAIAALGARVGLAAGADPDAARRAEFRATFASTPVFASAEEMLSRVPADVLVVATTPDAHAELISLGMANGLHLLCEKPLTVTPAEHVEISATCARRPDLALVPTHQYRYSPQWRRLARWARLASRFGQPYELSIDIQRQGTDRHASAPWRF